MGVTHYEVMKAVGTGYGTDYLNLAVRVDGTEVIVEGTTNSHTALSRYVDTIRQMPEVTKVTIEAKVIEGS